MSSKVAYQNNRGLQLFEGFHELNRIPGNRDVKYIINEFIKDKDLRLDARQKAFLQKIVKNKTDEMQSDLLKKISASFNGMKKAIFAANAIIAADNQGDKFFIGQKSDHSLKLSQQEQESENMDGLSSEQKAYVENELPKFLEKNLDADLIEQTRLAYIRNFQFLNTENEKPANHSKNNIFEKALNKLRLIKAKMVIILGI